MNDDTTGLSCTHNHADLKELDLSDDAVTDEIVEHMRDCEDLNCPRCPFDDEPELDPYEQARQLARFEHEDRTASQCP
jgi:hypothetical protein